jgi:antitoxin component YwqK of YwqJK toxin-antitoxin module
MRPLTLLLLPFLFCFQLVCAQDPFPEVRGRGGFYVDGFVTPAKDLSCLEGFQTLALIIPIEAIPNADSYYMYMSASHSSLGDLFRNYGWELQVSVETFRSFIYRGHFFMWILHPTEGYFKTAKSLTSFLDKEILCSAPKSKSIDIKFSFTGYDKMVVTKYDADCKCTRTFVSQRESFSSYDHTYYCSIIPDNEKTREAYPGVSPKALGPVPVLPGRGGLTVIASDDTPTDTQADTPTDTPKPAEPAPAKAQPQAPPKPVDRYVKEMRDNGTIRREGQLVNERQVGTWKEYYPNGKMSVESNYVEGKLHGLKTEWDEEGNKESAAEYQNGKLLGRQEDYYNGKLSKEYTKGADGLEGICKEYSGSYLVSQKNFVKGVQEGEEREFSSTDGSLEEISHYVNGKLHGVYQEFKEGVLVEEGAYENGEKSGTWKEYYWPAGKLREQYQLIGEKKVGEYKEFKINGKVAKVGQYANDGKETGDWIEYNDAGKISMTYTYVNGVFHGPYKIYHEGKVIRTINYINGTPQQ